MHVIHVRPKSRGAGLMVSDFIDDSCGFLRLSDEEFQSIPEGVEKPETKEAREILEYGARREGYWDN